MDGHEALEGQPLVEKRGGVGFHTESVAVLALCPWTVFVVVAAAFALPPPTPTSRFVFFLVVCAGSLFAALLLCVYFLRPVAKRPRLYLYLGLMVSIAVLGGWIAGRMIFIQDTAQFWLESARPTYANVLPSSASAEGLADAAFIKFAEGARVHLSRVLDYRPHGSSTTYCVAPILDDKDMGKAEFWAAGRDCCGRLRDFFCGDAMDPSAHAGAVISMEASEVASQKYDDFRQAVHQASALYHMVAPERPILVRWLKDPESEHGGIMLRAVMSFLFVCLLYLMVSVVSALWFHWSTVAKRRAA